MADWKSRPAVPVVYADEREHRRQLAVRANASLPHDGTGGMTAPLALKSLVVADLSEAAYAPGLWEGAVVYVSDGNSGEKLRYSDGTSWVIAG